MIKYVTGTLGAGKSMYGARGIGKALLRGRVVATNVRLADGWEEMVCKHNPYFRFAGRETRIEYMRDLRKRFFYSEDWFDLVSTRIHGRGEMRGLMVLDEAHNELNNRSYKDEDQKRTLRKMTLARKRGWEVYVISQNMANTDVAIRRIAAAETKLTNWRQMLRVPLLGTPLLPVPIFLAITYSLNTDARVAKASKVMYREMFAMSWFRKLYDTFQDYDTTWEDGVVYLPHSIDPKERPANWRADPDEELDVLLDRGATSSVPSESWAALRERVLRPAPSPRPSGEGRTPNDPAPSPTSASGETAPRNGTPELG